MARKMKDSGIEWIGEIPEGWEIAKAKYFIDISHGSDPKTQGFIPVYGSGSESFKTCGEYKEGPAVLIGRKGATLHIPHYIEGKYWNVDTAFDVKSKSHCILKFYYYLAACFDYKYYISQTTLPGMTQSNYYNMFLPVPSLSKQFQIATYLDAHGAAFDFLISKVRSSIEEYKKLKQAVITQAVTKGVRGEREMKDSGVEWIGEIPKEWDIIKSSRIIKTTQNGLSRRDLEKSEGQIILKLKNITSDGKIDYSFLNRITLSQNELNTYALTTGDFLFVRVNGSKSLVGKCAIFEAISEIVAYNDHIIRVKLSNQCYNRFFLWYLYSCCGKAEIDLHTSTAAGQYTISGDGLRDITLVFPPIDEQKEIADYLDAKCAEIDGLIAKKEQLVKELESYKKSLIYEVVTGKREV